MEYQIINLLITFFEYMLLSQFYGFLVAYGRPCTIYAFRMVVIWNNSI